MFLKKNRRRKNGREFTSTSAIGDMLGEDFSLGQKDKLYQCHDRLLTHKQALFSHLRSRWTDLFGARFEILLDDLTRTYFVIRVRTPRSGVR